MLELVTPAVVPFRVRRRLVEDDETMVEKFERIAPKVLVYLAVGVGVFLLVAVFICLRKGWIRLRRKDTYVIVKKNVDLNDDIMITPRSDPDQREKSLQNDKDAQKSETTSRATSANYPYPGPSQAYMTAAQHDKQAYWEMMEGEGGDRRTVDSGLIAGDAGEQHKLLIYPAGKYPPTLRDNSLWDLPGSAGSETPAMLAGRAILSPLAEATDMSNVLVVSQDSFTSAHPGDASSRDPDAEERRASVPRMKLTLS